MGILSNLRKTLRNGGTAVEEKREIRQTRTGAPIKPITRGLPKTVESLCPECLKVIPARMFEENGRVMMEKTCPEHGYFKDLYWSDVDLYLKAERWHFMDGEGFENPLTENTKGCPYSCGLCNLHTSTSCLINIDLTNRCNLSCPICFANANAAGFVVEPTFDQVVEMLRRPREEKPDPATAVQFAGGEPTLHPQFVEIIAAARELGYTHIQVASNGLKFADFDFTLRCKEAGLHTIYLQFDGVDDTVYEKTRGRKLFAIKDKVVDNFRKAGMKVVLVPTIVNTINDHQVGPILLYAIENRDVISGISAQPVTFTGRIDATERMKMRFTLPDMARCIEEQTGLISTKDDWYPVSCVSPFPKFIKALTGTKMVNVTCHPHCGLGTFIYIDKDDNVYPVTRFVDVEGFLTELYERAERLEHSWLKLPAKLLFYHNFKKYYREKYAPPGLSYFDFIESLYGLIDKKIGRSGKWGKDGISYMFVAGMHFMDAYNYQTERVRRCVIHYSTLDGKIYPFCSYNSGPTNRDRVEREFAIPLEEWRKRQER